MSPLRLLPLMIFVAACAPLPNNASRVSSQGATEIQLQNGRNCWENRCVHVNKQSRIAAVTARNSVRIPRNIDVSDGYVTVAEYQSIYSTANRAIPIGVGDR